LLFNKLFFIISYYATDAMDPFLDIAKESIIEWIDDFLDYLITDYFLDYLLVSGFLLERKLFLDYFNLDFFLVFFTIFFLTVGVGIGAPSTALYIILIYLLIYNILSTYRFILSLIKIYLSGTKVEMKICIGLFLPFLNSYFISLSVFINLYLVTVLYYGMAFIWFDFFYAYYWTILSTFTGTSTIFYFFL